MQTLQYVFLKKTLTITTFLANSADNKLTFFLYFPENRVWNYMQNVPLYNYTEQHFPIPLHYKHYKITHTL